MTRKHEHLLAMLMCLVVAILSFVGATTSGTFRLFFSWPNGGTWSNTIAWIEDGLVAAFFVWYLRDHVGRGLAAWWHGHQVPHLDARLDSVREHVSNELLQFEQRIGVRLAAHHDRVVKSVRDGEAGGDGPGAVPPL